MDQGEGASPTSSDFKKSHWYRFYSMYLELTKLQLKYAETEDNMLYPPWNPSYPVLENPTLSDDPYILSLGANKITHPLGKKVAGLFAICYETMLQLLTFSMMGTSGAHGQAQRMGKIFNLGIDMMLAVMKPIGEVLCAEIPSGYQGMTAGPVFEVSVDLTYLPIPEVAQKLFVEKITELAQAASKINELPPSVASNLRIIANSIEEGLDFPSPLVTPPYPPPCPAAK